MADTAILMKSSLEALQASGPVIRRESSSKVDPNARSVLSFDDLNIVRLDFLTKLRLTSTTWKEDLVELMVGKLIFAGVEDKRVLNGFRIFFMSSTYDSTIEDSSITYTLSYCDGHGYVEMCDIRFMKKDNELEIQGFFTRAKFSVTRPFMLITERRSNFFRSKSRQSLKTLPPELRDEHVVLLNKVICPVAASHFA